VLPTADHPSGGAHGVTPSAKAKGQRFRELVQTPRRSMRKSTPNDVSPKFCNPNWNVPRVRTWRTLSGAPFFSCKRAFRGPGVTENRGYMLQR